jgi:hypothetical protein
LNQGKEGRLNFKKNKFSPWREIETQKSSLLIARGHDMNLQLLFLIFIQKSFLFDCFLLFFEVQFDQKCFAFQACFSQIEVVSSCHYTLYRLVSLFQNLNSYVVFGTFKEVSGSSPDGRRRKAL